MNDRRATTKLKAPMTWAARSVVAAAVLVGTIVAIDIHPAYADRTTAETATISAQTVSRDGESQSDIAHTVLAVKPAKTLAFVPSDGTALAGLAGLLGLTASALMISRRKERATSGR